MTEADRGTKSTEILIGDPERFKRLMEEFRIAGPSRIAAIVDYDGTISPLEMNSWDIPGLSNLDWPTIAGKLRRSAKIGEISEDEFWLQSISSLNEKGFGNSESTFEDVVVHLENACLLIREGVHNLFQTCSQLGRFIIYSAGIKAVIEPHVAKISQIADISESDIPSVVSNELDGSNLITISGKTGTTLLHELDKQGVNLNGISHFVLIGDSIGDARMSDGLQAEAVIKIGLLSTAKAVDPSIKASYIDTFDIVIVSDDSIEDANTLIEQFFDS
ncbi:hypothetical protein KC675_03305 [Candidatus Dojkabacteria bacterium]|uniref:5'-nucleotidase n=1 Tax=Candidatus Dojkabacteria bacterium TaxID=2099670 RepID=A0A955I9B5_9BACT|nr:hypothetical protein [Candidatus Dojkabacteria bacterium]